MNSSLKIEKLIGYKFKNKSILDEALTHKSFSSKKNNEILEFLGDRVLSMIVTKQLIKVYSKDDEGVLDKKLSKLVDKSACFLIAKKIKLNEFIKLGSTEIKSNGNNKKSILADCCEALIGAIFQDGGIEYVENFILSFWKEMLLNLDKRPIDHKSALQEWSLKKYQKVPIYNIAKQSGPDHSPTFLIEVSFKNYISAKAEANSIKDAEKKAANSFMEINKIL